MKSVRSKETGIDRNPADEVEVEQPNDQRDRYLSASEIAGLKASLDGKMYRIGAGPSIRRSTGCGCCC
jgi:hypothetical protein